MWYCDKYYTTSEHTWIVCRLSDELEMKQELASKFQNMFTYCLQLSTFYKKSFQYLLQPPSYLKYLVLKLVFCRELDDAVIGAQQRIKGVPTSLPVTDAIEHYLQSNSRLLVLVQTYAPEHH